MSKTSIGFSAGLKLHGNINRILEMTPHLGDNAISGHFKDNGIDVSPQFVREIRLNVEAFSSKALPKKTMIAAIKAVQKDKEQFDSDDSSVSVF
ncbi:MAG: hypothetical protein PHQ03_10595 [Methylococcales bacterium]|nr:hypothetical protein [Methylococcales bacterium]